MKNSINSLVRKLKPEEVKCDPLGLWGTDERAGKYLMAEFEGYEVPTQSPNLNLQFLTHCAQNLSNAKAVEVGVFGGYLSLNLAKLLKGKNSKVYSVDIWEQLTIDNGNITYLGEIHPDYLDDARHWFKNMRFNYQNILKELNYDHVTIIQKPSLEAVNDFEDKELDLIFIDSDHSKEHVLKELRAWYPKLKGDGTICGDDYGTRLDAGGVSEALDVFCKENNFTLDVYAQRCWKIKR